MSRLRRTLLASLLLAACADDVGDAGSETQTTAATTATTTASTTGGGTATTGDGTSGSETSSGSSASGAATTDAISTSSDTTDDTTSTTGFTPTVGDGVFLYTGAGGDNYDTDAAAVEALYAGAGVKVTRSETIAGDITADHGCLVLLNPSQALPAAVGDAAQALLDGGGRVVFQTEHSGYGGHDVANALLADLGATIRSVEESESGWPELTLTPAPPLTDGVSELAGGGHVRSPIRIIPSHAALATAVAWSMRSSYSRRSASYRPARAQMMKGARPGAHWSAMRARVPARVSRSLLMAATTRSPAGD